MKKLACLAFGAILLSTFFSPGLAMADVNDFTVTSFTSDQTLTRNDPQGELRIVEKIDVEFTDNNHGIERAVPNRYKNHSLQLKINNVKSTSGAPSQYTTYGSNGNVVLRIGDPDRTVTGKQQYTIDYTVRNVITFYEEHDELYWDVNGDQWEQPFTQVSANLHLPAGLRQSRSPVCYSGYFDGKSQNCTIADSGNLLQTVTTQPLLSQQTLTYVAAFEKGYFKPSTAHETAGEYWKQLISVLLPILFVGGGSAFLWWRKGRDPKGKGIIIPQYEAPDNMKPLAVGELMDFKVDNRDITAAIIDLAIRGYIKIVETKEDKLIGKDKLNYTIHLLNTDFSKLDADERLLITSLFTPPTVGAVLDISASKNKLYNLSQSLKKDVKDRLRNSGYLRKSLFSTQSLMRVLGTFVGVFLLAIIVFAIEDTPTFIGFFAGTVIALPFLLALNARTAKGVAAKEHIFGLKRYLEVAEKDRIEKLQAPNAPYAANLSEPVKTVNLFEKLLPYALVLGVEQQWAKQFEGLYNTPPDWYSGNWNTFNAAYLASSLNDGVGSAVNSAFSAPSNSSGSGFSGGFSGGGGGGGGGGGW